MNTKVFLIIRIIVSLILLQTLQYKFTAHPDSVFIFSKIGLEPYGRIGIGILELIAAILICIPLSFYYGFAGSFLGEFWGANTAAKMTLGQMSEALFIITIGLKIRLSWTLY